MKSYMNRLIHETSPYLLQHAHNPVDWYPWGEEALAKARAEDKPILLSIGYSACHWCHVMEHESFEDGETAGLMNELFVSIKVDREERPDLDTIYMNAVQAMTGRGGWPMTVFLTPDGRPFYGGTYFPPEDRHGLPGFRRVLLSAAQTYRDRREEIEQSANHIRDHIERLNTLPASGPTLSRSLLRAAYDALWASYDAVHGGFGRAPKFPPSMSLEFLLRTYQRTGERRALSMVENTLQKMARGGLYDQLGGGFHRYSVDAVWLVPHFEKMLYDNALLSRLYLHAYQVTGDTFYRCIAEETLDYVAREMTASLGGFYSTQDADSEGEEGRFFVWTPGEIRSVLGEEEGSLFCHHFGVTGGGNFEGRNILHVRKQLAEVSRETGISAVELQEVIDRGRTKLFAEREKRVKPGRDDKVLTAWNGLMLKGFAEAARVLRRSDYLQIALANADFLLSTLRRDGRLLRTYKDGQARLNGYLEDYAFLVDGLLALYEATFDQHWFEEARALTDTMIEQFWDDVGGGFFKTSRDHETLITRPKDFFDNAVPSGNSVAADVLLRLAILTSEPKYERKAVTVLELTRDAVAQHPSGFGHLLCALDFHLSRPKEIAIVGDPESAGTQALLDVVFGCYLPNKVVALVRPDDPVPAQAISLLEGRHQIDGKATAYVCENYTCQLPVTDPEALAEQLG